VFRGYWMISWFLREFAGPEREEARLKGVRPESLLDRFLREVPAGSMGLMTLPHWGAQLKDPAAKGSMIGLGEVHTRGHFYRSLIEGLGFALRDGLERIERAGGIRCEQIGLAGGAAQSEEICQITADIFGRPLCAGETFEAAGLGAAVITATGAGLHGSMAEAVRRMVRPGRVYAPRARDSELYRQLFLKVHRRIQRRLAPLNAQIRQILDYPERAGGAR
jgi:sugar (pentulose or hexulose) kinase